jgi:uncharacterized protein (DUF2147 family)
MKRVLFLFLCTSFFSIFSMQAQVKGIVGDWKTVDDKTGESFSIVNIYQAKDGLYYGKITKMLVGPKGERCVECEGEDYNKPLEGLIIIRGMKAENGQLVGGKVLDPDSGKFYYGKIYLKDGKLVLRGSLDKRGFLGRNQTWLKP